MKPASLFASFIAAMSVTFGLAACNPDDSAVDDGWKIGTHVDDWRDEVIYQLLVDRFADGDLSNDQNVNPSGLGRFQGGDWQGVIDHIDYLQALGVTAVWISPVVRNVDTDANFDSYHGYWAQDLTHTNPHFGDLPALRRMVQALHAKKIKVILDIVTNHMGQLFYYDINENGVPDTNVYGQGCPPPLLNRGCTNPQITQLTEYDPDYDPKGVQAYTSLGFSGPAPIRWLFIPEIHRMPPMPVALQNKDFWNKRGRIVDYTNMNHQPTDQVITGDFPGGLKDLKTSLPEVQDELTKDYTYWIGAADFDGFRIDTLKHVEHAFWQKFAPGVRAYAKDHGKKNFFMFGEAFDGDDVLTGSYTFNNEVDSVFYFPQKFRVFRDVFQTNAPTKGIEDLWNERPKNYETVPHENGPVSINPTTHEVMGGVSTQDLLVNFLDNHDIPRFSYDLPCIAKDNCPALWNALSLLFTESGLPCVYYGTEQEFSGGNDPSNRERLWDSGYATTGKTFQVIRTLSDTRKRYSPLRRGITQVRWSSTRTGAERDAGIFAFERTQMTDGKRALVVLNVKDDKESTTQAPYDLGGGKMFVGFAPDTELVNVLPDWKNPSAPAEHVTVGGDGMVAITVGARGTKIFVAKDDQAGIAPLPGSAQGGP